MHVLKSQNSKVHLLSAKNLPAELPGYGLGYLIVTILFAGTDFASFVFSVPSFSSNNLRLQLHYHEVLGPCLLYSSTFEL